MFVCAIGTFSLFVYVTVVKHTFNENRNTLLSKVSNVPV